MSTKTVIGVAAAVVVAGAVFYWFAAGQPHTPMLASNEEPGAAAEAPVQDNMGTYPYQCDNGADMTMTPASDMSAVSIAPNGVASQGKIPTATLKANAFDGGPATFTGQGITFVGAGEEITLTMDTTVVHCNPLPNPDEAPFNWGDAGDGGGR